MSIFIITNHQKNSSPQRDIFYPPALFSIKQDNEVITSGGFWCSACLTGKPSKEQSPDPRYCQGCYKFLQKEADTLKDSGSNRKPSWRPKENENKASKKSCRVSGDVSLILSTVNGEKIRVDKNTPRTRINRGFIKRRGRQPTDLPLDIINELASCGMGSKAIAAKLLQDFGIVANYRTIARKMQGELSLN